MALSETAIAICMFMGFKLFVCISKIIPIESLEVRP